MNKMDSIVEGLIGQLTSGDNLSLMSNKVGADNKAVKSALEVGLPLLLGSMNNKASKPEGAKAIFDSLSNMGKGYPTENLADYLNAPESQHGSDLLSSLLGNNLQPIQQSIAKSTGLPPAVVGQILAIALPMLMGSLGKNFGKQYVGPGDLSRMLKDQSGMALSASPEAAGVLKELLAPEQSSGLLGFLKRFMKF
jgi:hypothetical protein